MSTKIRNFFSFALFFIGVWTIPFWYPFILQGILEFFLRVFGLNYNLDMVGDFLIWLYCGFSILLGYSIKDDEEWYMLLLSYLSYFVGLTSVIYLLFYL